MRFTMPLSVSIGLVLCASLLGLGCADDASSNFCPDSLGCDDGRECTIDSCNASGTECIWTLAPDTCLIGGVCHAEGATNPLNACEVCQPALDARGWTPRPNGTTCAEGNQCVESSQCQEGICDAPEKACDDEKQCTLDTCDPAVGCTHEILPWGTPCEDGDICTTGEVCMDETCSEATANCDDQNPCTTDVCDPADGCVNTPNSEPCDDGDPCSSDGQCEEGKCQPGQALACDDGNPCTLDTCDTLAGCHHVPNSGLECDDGDPCTTADICDAGTCEGGAAAACDDGNPCTTDLCVEGEGCVGEAVEGDPCCTDGLSICDDGDPCTQDTCDGETLACSYTAGDGSCDDDDACTKNDTCADGECAGSAVDCDDGNDCTMDTCDPGVGCVYGSTNGTPCEDGLECSVEDVCTDGTCVGDYENCFCAPDFADDSVKCNSLAIAPDDATGFDLNGDGDVDNALAAVAGLVNTSIGDALLEGDVMLLFEFRGPIAGESSIAAYQAELADPDDTCDYQSTTCAYDVMTNSLTVDNGQCQPMVSMPVVIDGKSLQGGGPGTNFPFEIPLGDAVLDIVLKDVMVSAQLLVEDGSVIGLSGMIGGAVPEAELVGALEQLPADALGDAFTPEQVVGLIPLLTDIDTDGDGSNDALSAAILIEAIDSHIVGYN